jgi:hypothetical protein
MQTKIVEIENPLFCGFYYTILSSDREEEYVIESDDQELGGYISDHDLELEFDYKIYELNVVARINDLFIEIVNDICKYQLYGVDPIFDDDLIIKKVDEEMTSPREYNFSTDRAFMKVEVNYEMYKKIIEYVFTELKDEPQYHLSKNL